MSEAKMTGYCPSSFSYGTRHNCGPQSDTIRGWPAYCSACVIIGIIIWHRQEETKDNPKGKT